MNRHRVFAIAGNELRQVLGSRDYLVPLAAMAALFFVLIPVFLLTGITRVADNSTAEAVGVVLDVLPSNAQENVKGETVEAQAGYALAVYLLAPIAIVVPLTIAAAIGAGAVVGERERGTGEFLAHSPATEREIYLGKLAASLLPGFVVTLVGFALYSVIVNTVVGPSVGGWFFPTPGWWLLIFWVVPPFLTVALSVIVAISARARTVTAAQQASQLVTLPVILAAYGISTGLVFDSRVLAIVVGGLAWLAAALALTVGGTSVARARLVGAER